MTEDDRNALVVRPSAEVGRIGVGAESVLSRIVSDALVLARSRTASLTLTLFRVGRYEFRDADYRQIVLWANALEKTPEEIVETLESQRFERPGDDVISFRVGAFT